MEDYRWVGHSRPPKDRLALCKAFIGKAKAFAMLGVCSAAFRASDTG
ncbi:MAG: hypothetical protein NTU53_14385 [Planctomycetota bacterium]|nr:hypothetical protein [Planctomycetota bacterium]